MEVIEVLNHDFKFNRKYFCLKWTGLQWVISLAACFQGRNRWIWSLYFFFPTQFSIFTAFLVNVIDNRMQSVTLFWWHSLPTNAIIAIDYNPISISEWWQAILMAVTFPPKFIQSGMLQHSSTGCPINDLVIILKWIFERSIAHQWWQGH